MNDNWSKCGQSKCGHCGYIHDGVCPRIKFIEYYENGMIKKIEYHGQNNEPLHSAFTEEDEANLPF